MTKISKLLITFSLLLTFLITPVQAAETQSTSFTVTNSITGENEISQDAYLLSGAYLQLGLKNPQDLYVIGNMVYVADTDNSRVLAINTSDETVKVIGENVLSKPTGIAADKEGKIYVADSGNKEAYRFDNDGNLEFTFVKPTTPNFGKNQGFNPVKVAPADAGGVYLISEGSLGGIVHMSGMGDFLGYFASNEVEVGIFEKMVDIFLTEEQQSAFLKRTPPSFGNIFRGNDGLVYTMNKGLESRIKKHSISGLDMLNKIDYLPEVHNPVDICVNKDGIMYVLDAQGAITEITSDGYLLSSFGGNDQVNDRLGLFKTASGIGVDDSGRVYVLDSASEYIQVFNPTKVQSDLHRAINLYNDGDYDASKALLEEILKLNNSSFFAHLYIGKNYMQEANYDKAAEHYRIANAKGDYSDAYWEIRNLWLQNNMIYILLTVIIVTVVCIILGFINEKYKIFAFIDNFKKKLLGNKFIFDLSKIGYSLKHPIDNAYYVRKNKIGSYLSATLIYTIVFALLVLYQIGTGFVFAQNIEEYSIISTLLYYLVIVGLFIIGNYFISSINDGNGTIKSIYITTAYSLSPLVLFMPFIIIFANFSTVNEKFFIDTAILVLVAWSICNMVVSLIEIHEYSFVQTVKNILLTLFFMGVAILAASVGYLLLRQIFEFIITVMTEVALRA